MSMKRVFILITVLAFARLSFAISPIEDYYWFYLFEETTFDVSHQKIGELYYDLSSESRLAQVVATGEGETPYGGAVTIPEKVVYENEDYTVFAIGDHAFRDCNNITKDVTCTSRIMEDTLPEEGGVSFENNSNYTFETSGKFVMEKDVIVKKGASLTIKPSSINY